MKLTKEECDNATTRLYRPYFASTEIQNSYYDINGKDNSISDDCNLIEQLIHEHFKDDFSHKENQLTVEEIEALSRYYQDIMRIMSRNMLNIFELAYNTNKADLDLCISAIEKLQKQKELLEK